MRSRALRLAALVLLLGLIVLVVREVDSSAILAEVRRLSEAHPHASMWALTLIYAAAIMIGIPAMPFPVAAGALFGLGLGTLFAWLGEVISAVACFGIARTFGHDRLQRWLAGTAWFDSMFQRAEENSLKVSVLVRGVGIIPLTVQHYALGLMPIRFRDLMIGTLAMIPSTFVLALLGTSTGSMMGWFWSTLQAGSKHPEAIAATLAFIVTAGYLYLRRRRVRRGPLKPAAKTSEKPVRRGHLG